jgi:RNA ligase
MAVLLSDVLPLAELKEEIKNGYVNEQKHPDLPLYILNYTHKTQIEKRWNNITTRCRGLIYRKDAESKKYIVSHPFKKFFNVGERDESSLKLLTELIKVNDFKYRINEKLDGSMGVIWWYTSPEYKQHYGVATRGSFTSPQAIWATKWLHEHVLSKRGVLEFGDFTPIVEIIYPKNRIVVDYPFSGLVLLGLVKWNGIEMLNYRDIRSVANRNYLPVVKQFANLSLEEAMTHDRKNFEGYVVTVHKASSIFRAKIKMPDYVRLHKMITGWNPKNVWEWLKDGKDYSELLEPSMPKHFVEWFTKWVKDLTAQYADYENQAKKLFENIHVGLRDYLDDSPNRKDYALAFERQGDFAPVLFKMLDKQDYSDIIWKKIKPSGEEPFIDAEPDELEPAPTQTVDIKNPTLREYQQDAIYTVTDGGVTEIIEGVLTDFDDINDDYIYDMDDADLEYEV